MDTRGTHLMGDLWGVDLFNKPAIASTAMEAARMAGLRVLGDMSHKFEPYGETVLLLLAESHLSVHTYPEAGYVAVDVFTCGNGDPEVALQHLIDYLEPKEVYISRARRGAPGGIVF